MRALSPSEQLLAASLCPGVPVHIAVAAVLADRESFAEPPTLSPKHRTAWRAALEDGALERALDAELAALDHLHARAVTPLDPDWPADLPARGVLRVRGSIPVGPRIAIVGSRQADRAGLDLTRRIARDAVAAGVAVVSGGAFGVDAAAPLATVEAGGRSVAVLGAGLLHPSPASHRRLFDRLLEGGAVLSMFPCAVPPSRWTFPARNAWIAGLATATVVVQAGLKSGALYTAEAARTLGRPVFAVPGPVDHPLHEGCHALIAAGALLLARTDGWRDAFGAVPTREIAPRVATGPALDQHREPEVGAALWRAAGLEPSPLAMLAEAAGVPVAEAASLATLLELTGWLRAWPGGRYARTARAPEWDK